MSPVSWLGKCIYLRKLSKPAHTVLCKHLHNIFIWVRLSAVNDVNSRCVCVFVFGCRTRATGVCATSACEIATGRTQAVLFKECTACSLGNHFPWRREKETRILTRPSLLPSPSVASLRWESAFQHKRRSKQPHSKHTRYDPLPHPLCRPREPRCFPNWDD